MGGLPAEAVAANDRSRKEAERMVRPAFTRSLEPRAALCQVRARCTPCDRVLRPVVPARMCAGASRAGGRMPSAQPHAPLRKRPSEGSASRCSRPRTGIMPTARWMIHAAWPARTRPSSAWSAASRLIRTSAVAWNRPITSLHQASARLGPRPDERLSQASACTAPRRRSVARQATRARAQQDRGDRDREGLEE